MHTCLKARCKLFPRLNYLSSLFTLGKERRRAMERNANHGHMGKKVIIREFDGERDLQHIEKLERDLEIGSRRGFSIFTNMMGDPLCRIRLYPNHIMLVAELVGECTLVGVVRGCIKCVGTGLGAGDVKTGCILGLRVSPKHRRFGIGTKLIKSVEGWAIRNGAQYLFLATEENNIASINLFVHKCNYTRLSSLAIIFQPIDINTKKTPSSNINIEKLSIEQAISLYNYRLGGDKLFPLDIDSILKEQLSLGTWVAHFKEEHWIGLHGKENDDDDDEFISNTPSSWAILSIWKTYESYRLQIRGAPLVRCFHATLSHIGSKVLPCLKVSPSLDLLSSTPFGFLFVYGLHGEGGRVGDLMRSLWNFACHLGGSLKECKAVVTELGIADPIKGHVPQGSSTSNIDDVWFLKKVNSSSTSTEGDLAKGEPLSRVFVDPRDF